MEKRHVVTNSTRRMLLVFTEPEAQDYWVRPGESVELRADTDTPADDFVIEETADGVTVWPSGRMGCISVWSGGVELPCGHQRPAGWH